MDSVYRWCIAGVSLVYRWCIAGVSLVYRWCIARIILSVTFIVAFVAVVVGLGYRTVLDCSLTWSTPRSISIPKPHHARRVYKTPSSLRRGKTYSLTHSHNSRIDMTCGDLKHDNCAGSLFSDSSASVTGYRRVRYSGFRVHLKLHIQFKLSA
ncbi:hypothetical protein EX30DRAFT_120973 [Ascodesmis nigricans]|uniref:Uncharacterized protein n=1 Tax=Ascodesmis nigricans TaxID=341454 RepID=A0A4S2MSJ7_9PEZI|nr:hypothetical protein EX30DRAFT_120973 [Ascodesmis nigricans]